MAIPSKLNVRQSVFGAKLPNLMSIECTNPTLFPTGDTIYGIHWACDILVMKFIEVKYAYG